MPLPTPPGKKAASPSTSMSSGSPALRERLAKLQATGKKARQKTKPSKKTGPPQFSPVLTAKAAAPAPTAPAPTPKPAPVPAPAPSEATPTIKKLQAAYDAPAPDTLASTPPSSPARARAHSAPESVSRSSSLGSIADLKEEAAAARRRKDQLQAENAKNAERLGSPRRDPLAGARTPPASPPQSPPRSPRRPTLEMEELAATEAEVVAKLEADAKAKARREKELRRRRSPSASPRQQAASRKQQAAPAEPATAAAKPAPAIPAIAAAKSSPPVAGKSARKPRRSGPPKLLLEAPKLHDLPLDGPRTARATVKALPPVPMRVSPPLEVLLAAFASVLSRHARQDVVVVGVEGHPVALACEKNDAFCERVEKARAALRAASFTLEDVLEATSTILDRTYHPVYQASIAATHEFGSQLLDLELVPTHSELGLRYRSDLFAERAAKRFLVQTKSYVDAMLVEGNALAVDHLVIEDDDYLSTVVTPNETRQPWPEAACIHDLMFKAAEEHPGAICLQGAQECTYDQFSNAVRAVADALGPVYPDDRVALLLERDASMVAAIYGVLSAGGCYVPLEPDYPLERLKTVVEDASCKACVTQARLRAGVLATFFSDLERPRKLVNVVELDVLQPFSPPERAISPDPTMSAPRPLKRVLAHHEPAAPKPKNLAYVFYTSGTTGKPKGVMVEHRGLVRRIAWFQRRYPLTSSDVMLLKTTYTFGISEWELFWAPTVGASTLVAGAQDHKDASTIASLLQRCTVCCFVPSALAATAEALIEARRRIHLKCCISCGEALSASVARLFFECTSNSKLVNVYGPTEADMTFYEIDRNYAMTMVRCPIGVPMDNVTAYVLDDDLLPVPCGAPGQLYFGAEHACRGYLNLPQLTKKCWVANPFLTQASPKTPAGKLLYATGDLARWRPDGQLEFRGRVSGGQIKLRGFRIELEDVAAALRSCGDVGMSTAQLLDADKPTARLIGYVVEAGRKTKDGGGCSIVDRFDLADDALEAARAVLPAYALPSAVVELDRLPTTARGKLDRARLPPPPPPKKARDFLPCTTPTERIIERVWQELLGYDDAPLDAQADFVSLGGNSLLAGRATTKLRLALNLRALPGTSMYLYPTITELASYLDTLPQNDIQVEEKAVDVVYKGQSSTAPDAVFYQALVVVGSLLLDQAPSIVTHASVYITWRQFNACVAAQVGVLVSLVCSCVLVLVAVLANKWMAPARSSDIVRIPLFSGSYMRWLAAQHATRAAAQAVSTYGAGTPLLAAFYGACGAAVGDDVVLDAGVTVDDPQFVTLATKVRCRRHARVSAHVVERGELVLAPVVLERGAELGIRSGVGAGGVVKADHAVDALAHVEGGAESPDGDVVVLDQPRPPPPRFLRVCQYFIGVPLVLSCEAFATYVALRAVELCSFDRLLVAVWVFRLVQCEAFYILTVALKRLIIGKFAAGKRPGTLHDTWRRWVLDRLTRNALFLGATEPYVNTELLSWKYRLLGARIGSRVNVDFFDSVEYDLLDIGDEVVFGSCVVLAPSDDAEDLSIRIDDGANVLDHSVLLGGTVVEKRAVTGTCTLGPKGHVFPATSISTGRVRGAPVLLKFQGDVEDGTSKLPEADRERVLEALAAHRDPTVFYAFNAFCAASALLLEPATTALELAPVYFSSGSYVATFMAWLLAQLVPLGVLCLAKRSVIGAYATGDAPYYGDMHHRWVFMMALGSVADDLLDAVQGTCFAAYALRALGATIGEDCCLFYGALLEFDLLRIDSYASTGSGCDLTCHTVENMVVKFAPVTISKGASMRSGALCMPGGGLGTMATLSAGSQVLKGEVVPAAEFWSGLPASFASTVDDARSAFEGLRPPAVEGEFTPEGIASALGLSLPSAWKLFAAKARGDGDAERFFASLSRARKVAHLSRRRTLPPFHLRPPHLKPGKLAIALECNVKAAQDIIQGWRRGDADAVAAVRKGRVLLVAKHLEVDEDNAKAILRAARAGDEGSRAQLQSYLGGRGRGRGGRGRGRGRGKGRNVPPLRQLCVRALRRPRAGNGMLVGALVVSLAANLYLVLR